MSGFIPRFGKLTPHKAGHAHGHVILQFLRQVLLQGGIFLGAMSLALPAAAQQILSDSASVIVTPNPVLAIDAAGNGQVAITVNLNLNVTPMQRGRNVQIWQRMDPLPAGWSVSWAAAAVTPRGTVIAGSQTPGTRVLIFEGRVNNNETAWAASMTYTFRVPEALAQPSNVLVLTYEGVAL